jgi:hypothetical protein
LAVAIVIHFTGRQPFFALNNMSKITVYIKGAPGFMPAVITKLGRDWIRSGREAGDDVISFSLREEMSIDDFKEFIGTDIISEHSIVFLDELPGNPTPERPLNAIQSPPFKMSIWRNSDPKVSGTKSVKHNEETKT